MANVLAELFKNTAEAIREKTGDSGTMKPAEFPEKIRGIETGSTSKLVPLIVTENGTYIPGSAFDPSGGTYSFKASYTQEYLSALYAEASAVYEFPMNDFATGAFAIDNDDEAGNALAVICFVLGENNYYGLMKECDEPKFWVPVDVATMFEQSAEGWYSIVDESTMTFAPSDIPDYPIITGATYTVNMDNVASLFECDDFDGYSSVEVNVRGSATDVIVWTVTFVGADGIVLYEKPCLDGDDCYDPVITGKIDSPTKPSTPQYTYTHIGWGSVEGSYDASALTKVTEDRVVYAAFAAQLVYYTATFYEGDKILKTERVAYGAQATPPDTFRESYIFNGWDKEDFTITQDTAFYGTWTLDNTYAQTIAVPEDLDTIKVTYARYSGDGTKLFVTSGRQIRMYDTSTIPYTYITSITLSQDIYGIAVHPYKNLLVIGHTRSTTEVVPARVYKFDDTSISVDSDFPKRKYGTIPYAFNSTGTLFLCKSSPLDGYIYVYNVVDGQAWTLSASKYIGTSYAPTDLRFVNGYVVTAHASVASSAGVRIYDTDLTEVTSSNTVFDSTIYGSTPALAVSEYDTYIATGHSKANGSTINYDYSLRIYKKHDDKYTLLHTVPKNTFDVRTNGMVFVDDSLLAICTESSPYVRFYNADTNQFLISPGFVPAEKVASNVYTCNRTLNHMIMVPSTSNSIIIYKIAV